MHQGTTRTQFATTDLAEAVPFHRDRLGFDEAWRKGDETAAFWLPDRSAQLMVSTRQSAGPMYLVDSIDAQVRDHPDMVTAVEKFDIPGGSVAGSPLREETRLGTCRVLG